MNRNPEGGIVFFDYRKHLLFSSNYVLYGETNMLVGSMLDTQL